MVKIGGLLLSLLLWNNAYAWYCNYDNGSDGWYEEGTMVCVDIEVSVALEDHYCEWHRPEDPYCQQFQEPTCVDLIEYKTESCDTNYTGVKNYSRNYSCQTLSWNEWSLSSDLCSPLPPTCVASVDTRVEACNNGYEGQITYTRSSSCPDPYGEPLWLEWLEENNTCTLSVSDPVSPVSVGSPINPASPVQIDSVTVQQESVPQQTPNQPTVESVIQEELNETSDEVETSTSDKTDSTEEVKQDKQDRNDNNSKNDVDEVIEDGKEIVHGFGLVLSLETLNKPLEYYQPPLVDMFSIIQELPADAATREFHIKLFEQDHIQNYYDTVSDYTWERLRSGSVY